MQAARSSPVMLTSPSFLAAYTWQQHGDQMPHPALQRYMLIDAP